MSLVSYTYTSVNIEVTHYKVKLKYYLQTVSIFSLVFWFLKTRQNHSQSLDRSKCD